MVSLVILFGLTSCQSDPAVHERYYQPTDTTPIFDPAFPKYFRSQVSESKVDVVLTKRKRAFAVFVGAPLIATSVESPTHRIEIYVTPSCPLCINLVNIIFEQRVLVSKELETSSVVVFVVPRSDGDYEILKNLFCVPLDKVFAAVSEFFRRAYSDVLTMPDFDDTEMRKFTARLRVIAASIAVRHGSNFELLSKCQEAKKFDESLDTVWVRAYQQNFEHKWPLVIIDGKPKHVWKANEFLQWVREATS
jgi:hypothetical protein